MRQKSLLLPLMCTAALAAALVSMLSNRCLGIKLTLRGGPSEGD